VLVRRRIGVWRRGRLPAFLSLQVTQHSSGLLRRLLGVVVVVAVVVETIVDAVAVVAEDAEEGDAAAVDCSDPASLALCAPARFILSALQR
jgi:hypothetical protein